MNVPDLWELSEKWRGILALIGAVVCLPLAVYNYVTLGALSAWLLGGGIGLLLVGAMSLFYYFDDER